MIIPLIYAQTPVITSNPVFKVNEAITIPLPCTINGNYCSVNATCKTTIIDPENNVLVNNQAMVHDDAVFTINLTANQTSIMGEYQFNVVCSDNGNSVSRFLKFYITPNGELPNIAKGITYIGLILLLFVFFAMSIYGGFRMDTIHFKMAFYLLAYLIFIGIVFISWNTALDYLTSTPFLISFFEILFYVSLYGFPFVLLFLVVMIIITTVQTKEIKRLIDKGLSNEEAYSRAKKRKRLW